MEYSLTIDRRGGGPSLRSGWQGCIWWQGCYWM